MADFLDLGQIDHTRKVVYAPDGIFNVRVVP